MVFLSEISGMYKSFFSHIFELLPKIPPLTQLLLQNVGGDLLEKKPFLFFSFCIICRLINMMTVNNHVRNDVHV